MLIELQCLLAIFILRFLNRQEISEFVGIRAMPTFIAYKNGEKIGDSVGANPANLQVCSDPCLAFWIDKTKALFGSSYFRSSLLDLAYCFAES